MEHEDDVETEEYQGYTIHIKQDTDVNSPREEFDNFSTMWFWHRRMNLGDGHKYKKGEMMRPDQPMSEKELRAYVGEPIAYLTIVSGYEHSGFTIWSGRHNHPFDSAGWDSGRLGWAFATMRQVKECGFSGSDSTLRRKGKMIVEGDIETYDQYLRGEVYGYVIEDENGNEIDSVWGFYGLEFCTAEAKSIIDWKEHERKAWQAAPALEEALVMGGA